jgi:hypothetical protein
MSFRDAGTNLIEPILGPKGLLTHYNIKYLKSSEAVAEWKKAKLQYPDSPADVAYQEFLDRTPSGVGNSFSHQNYTRITAIYRYRLAPGREFLVWNQIEYRWNPVGNMEEMTLLNLGMYPTIIYKNSIKVEASGYRRPVTEPTGETRPSYSLEYTVENIDRLHKDACDTIEYDQITGKQLKPTRYYLRDLNKPPNDAYIPNWDDFRDGDFDMLWPYNKKIASEHEAQEIKDKREMQRKQVEEQKLDRLKRGL